MRVHFQAIFALLPLISVFVSNAQLSKIPDTVVFGSSELVSQTGRVEVYRYETNVDGGVAAEIDRLYTSIEEQLGRKFDTATLGKII